MSRGGTLTLTHRAGADSVRVPAVKLLVRTGKGAPIAHRLGLEPVRIGSGPECQLVVRDGAVSRVHCQIAITGEGVVVKDLDSKNGLLLSGARIREAVLPPGVALRLGSSELYWVAEGEAQQLPLSKGARFGEALGSSVPMRALFARLEQAAATDEPVVLIGESGTGKDLLAHGVHQASARADGPFVVMDCGAVAPALVEAELFGHLRGAFTGADRDRAGLLEQAHQGTLFLDEIGELPLALQTRLLRALEAKQVRRLGSDAWKPADARVVAATHRDLDAAVKAGTLREDLYYRLSVVTLHVPPLRDHKDDIPLLVERFLAAHEPPRTLLDLPGHALELLAAHDWPGNVRELRNTVTRLVLFPELVEHAITARDGGKKPMSLDVTLREARERAMDDFERTFLEAQLARHKGNVSAAAKALGVSRQFVHRLLAKHDIRPAR